MYSTVLELFLQIKLAILEGFFLVVLGNYIYRSENAFITVYAELISVRP